MTAPDSGPSTRARLGSFEVDLRSGELRSLDPSSPSGSVLLREQPFQILRMLIDRGGKIVTRAEIKKALWPNDTIVDFDHSINVAIGTLRRALGDSAASPRYIETLGRRGYRLLAAIDWPRTGSGSDGTAGVAPASPLRATADLVGTKLGHYRVIEVLGGGGMGMVYKAEDLKLGRSVALKFLPEELASDPVALARLEREARTASALNHPNICTIFDIEEYAGQKFIAMELLEGETLLHRIAAASPAPLAPLEVIDIGIQVCSGLQAAHEKDIIHRDIKPANIFLTRQGPVKLLDFGVAKQVGESWRDAGHGTSPLTEPSLTRTGASVGTAAYMSPEQARKEPLDARSDLYSLGLVLHEMATGRRPLSEESSAGADALSAGSEPRVVTPTPPRALEPILARALENHPARRFQTASEMRSDLERARARMRQHSGWYVWSRIAVALLAVLMASGFWLWLRRTRPVMRLAPDDTLVISHLTNQTSDQVLDDALYTGLRIALEQTPYLNVLAEAKVGATLAGMKLGADTHLTPEIALEVCRRTESKMMVSPSIANAGNRLRIGLSGVDCRSGAVIANVEQDAANRDAVVHALGMAAGRLRVLLGEPAQSIAKFNEPLERATSLSPEAVELLTLGYRRHLTGDFHEAIPYYERAVRADPDFALAHGALAVAHETAGHTELAAGSSRRAFELRDRLTEPARFNVEGFYYRQVMGKDDQTCIVVAQWVETFPHDLFARNNFATCLALLGEPDRALGQAREAARLLPSAWTYWIWVWRALDAGRLDEAKRVYEEALRRGLDSPLLRDQRAVLAFVEGDDETLRELWKWAQGKAHAEAAFNSGWARGEAFHGRLRASLRFAKAATALSAKEGEFRLDELKTILMRAEAGVRSPLPVAADTARVNLGERLLAGLTLARTGHLDGAERAANALRREFPSHTLIRSYGLPVIEGAIKLESNDAAGAIEVLRPTAKYELTNWPSFPSLYSAYLRGLAWLKMGDGQAAAAEFRKVLAHPGLVGRWAIGAMAHVQLARAQHLTGEDAAALSSYETFLALWKDADGDLPLYKEALAEYRGLRTRQQGVDGR